MSVREARLCDHDGCNAPSLLTCPLCNRDSCATHKGAAYLAVTVVIGMSASNQSSFLGKSGETGTCADCSSRLHNDARTISSDATHMPLSWLVVPLRDPLIEAAAALLATKKLEKPSS